MDFDSSTYSSLLLMGLPSVLTYFINSFYQSSSAILNSQQGKAKPPTPHASTDQEDPLAVVCVNILTLLCSATGPTLDMVFTSGCRALVVQLLDANKL